MEPTFSQVAAWSHAIAAVIHALFAVYLGLAWRNGSRGSFLIAAMGVSALWASANWAFALTGWNWLFLLGNLLDGARDDIAARLTAALEGVTVEVQG